MCQSGLKTGCMSALSTNTLSGIVIMLAHWNNSPWAHYHDSEPTNLGSYSSLMLRAPRRNNKYQFCPEPRLYGTTGEYVTYYSIDGVPCDLKCLHIVSDKISRLVIIVQSYASYFGKWFFLNVFSPCIMSISLSQTLLNCYTMVLSVIHMVWFLLWCPLMYLKKVPDWLKMNIFGDFPGITVVSFTRQFNNSRENIAHKIIESSRRTALKPRSELEWRYCLLHKHSL